MRTVARLTALLVVLAVLAPVVVAAPAAPGGTSSTVAQPAARSDVAATTGTGADPGPGAAAGVGPAGTWPVGDGPPSSAVAQQSPPGFDDHETDVRVRLYANGSASWAVETRYALDSEFERSVFSRYATDFERGATTAGYDVALFERAAANASAATGRSMAVVNPERTAAVENGSGVVRLTFVWRNFAESGANDTLVVGDAFRTPDNGSWLASLGTGQTVTVRAPPEYVVSSNPGFFQPNSRTIVVEGPRRFEGEDVQAFVVSYQPNPEPPFPWALVGGAIAVVAVVAVGAGYYVRIAGDGSDADPDAGPGTGTGTGVGTGSDPGDAPGAGDAAAGRDGVAGAADADGAAGGGGAAGAGDADGHPGSPVAGTGAGAGAAGAAGPASSTDGAAADADPDAADDGEAERDVDLELLSDEERVERLLRRNGGRMKQASIVSETGWSDAKVSQLLSSMAEADRVDKLRLGRENLISLPDEGAASAEMDDS
jgi:hypothetical protein